MREREVKARVKLLMISMGLRPDRRGFVLIAEAITEQAVKGLTMKSVYERLGRKLNQTRGCMERSMRLCINDLNVGAFAHQMNELTGFRVVTENMKLSCNAFVGMMAEVISIVYGIETTRCVLRATFRLKRSKTTQYRKNKKIKFSPLA